MLNFGKPSAEISCKDDAYRGFDTYNNGDNGKVFAKHQEIVKELQISFYFCKPYHSWERGAMGAWMTQLEIHS